EQRRVARLHESSERGLRARDGSARARYVHDRVRPLVRLQRQFVLLGGKPPVSFLHETARGRAIRSRWLARRRRGPKEAPPDDRDDPSASGTREDPLRSHNPRSAKERKAAAECAATVSIDAVQGPRQGSSTPATVGRTAWWQARAPWGELVRRSARRS